MFETAETGARIDKDDYEERLPDLRVALVNAQYDLRSADFPVIIVVDGDDWPGVQHVLFGFSDWMDGRYIQLHAMERPSDGDQMWPILWRFWHRLPGRAEIAVFANAWSVGAVRDRIMGKLDKQSFERRLRQIRRFENDQADDGALILKFWIHLPKKELKAKISKAKPRKKEKNGKSDHPSLHRSPTAELIYENYDEIMKLTSRLIEVTDEAASPWHIIESTDHRYLSMTIGETILQSLRARLDNPPPAPVRRKAPAPVRAHSILDQVDLDKKLEREEYKSQLTKYQERLFELTSEAHRRGVSSVLVFEGWDAAGKGGVIRRIVRGTDIRRTRVVPIGAPTDEELAHHYLWRFWRKLAVPGEMVIFDRSWYGRVLVERVEGLASENEWRRAYSEIKHFEEQLTDAGVVVQKFWLHIDPDEQLARFKAREQTAYKKYKITEEDYRNREKRSAYVAAIDEMIARTSTTLAPWHLIPANDKPYARVNILKKICTALKEGL